MSDPKPSSTSREEGSSNETSRPAPLQKGYGIDRRGYTPLSGAMLPIAPSTSTGESGSIPPSLQEPAQPGTPPEIPVKALRESTPSTPSPNELTRKPMGKVFGKPGKATGKS